MERYEAFLSADRLANHLLTANVEHRCEGRVSDFRQSEIDKGFHELAERLGYRAERVRSAAAEIVPFPIFDAEDRTSEVA